MKTLQSDISCVNPNGLYNSSAIQTHFQNKPNPSRMGCYGAGFRKRRPTNHIHLDVGRLDSIQQRRACCSPLEPWGEHPGKTSDPEWSAKVLARLFPNFMHDWAEERKLTSLKLCKSANPREPAAAAAASASATVFRRSFPPVSGWYFFIFLFPGGWWRGVSRGPTGDELKRDRFRIQFSLCV